MPQNPPTVILNLIQNHMEECSEKVLIFTLTRGTQASALVFYLHEQQHLFLCFK